jgi:hypothetical protein
VKARVHDVRFSPLLDPDPAVRTWGNECLAPFTYSSPELERELNLVSHAQPSREIEVSLGKC